MQQVAISVLNQGNVFRIIERSFKITEVIDTIQSAIEIYNLKISNRDLLEEIILPHYAEGNRK